MIIETRFIILCSEQITKLIKLEKTLVILQHDMSKVRRKPAFFHNAAHMVYFLLHIQVDGEIYKARVIYYPPPPAQVPDSRLSSAGEQRGSTAELKPVGMCCI